MSRGGSHRRSDPLAAALQRVAEDRAAEDPAVRMAGLIADAVFVSLSTGQQHQLFEQLRSAAAEVVAAAPYERRGMDYLLDELEFILVHDAPICDEVLESAPPPVAEVLFLVDRARRQDRSRQGTRGEVAA